MKTLPEKRISSSFFFEKWHAGDTFWIPREQCRKQCDYKRVWPDYASYKFLFVDVRVCGMCMLSIACFCVHYDDHYSFHKRKPLIKRTEKFESKNILWYPDLKRFRGGHCHHTTAPSGNIESAPTVVMYCIDSDTVQQTVWFLYTIIKYYYYSRITIGYISPKILGLLFAFNIPRISNVVLFLLGSKNQEKRPRKHMVLFLGLKNQERNHIFGKRPQICWKKSHFSSMLVFCFNQEKN